MLMSTSGRVSRGGPRQLEEAAEGVGPGASAPRCGRSGVRRAELATIAATQRGRAATCAKRAGAPPSTGTAPAVQLRARPCSTSPSGTVRVSRASVRRVPSTKAIATGAVPHQTAGAPRTPHRPRPDRTRRRAASRPTAGTRRRRAGIRRRGDREVVQVGGDVSSPVGRLRRPRSGDPSRKRGRGQPPRPAGALSGPPGETVSLPTAAVRAAQYHVFHRIRLNVPSRRAARRSLIVRTLPYTLHVPHWTCAALTPGRPLNTPGPPGNRRGSRYACVRCGNPAR